MYVYLYMYIYVCIYLCIYANNLNDPRHYFVIGPSSLFCMDVCDHIINVFPAHSLNKRFLILILILASLPTHVCVTRPRLNELTWKPGIEAGVLKNNQVNIIVAGALAPCVARSPAAIALEMQDKRVPVFQKEISQLPMPAKWGKM